MWFVGSLYLVEAVSCCAAVMMSQGSVTGPLRGQA